MVLCSSNLRAQTHKFITLLRITAGFRPPARVNRLGNILKSVKWAFKRELTANIYWLHTVATRYIEHKNNQWEFKCCWRKWFKMCQPLSKLPSIYLVSLSHHEFDKSLKIHSFIHFFFAYCRKHSLTVCSSNTVNYIQLTTMFLIASFGYTIEWNAKKKLSIASDEFSYFMNLMKHNTFWLTAFKSSAHESQWKRYYKKSRIQLNHPNEVEAPVIVITSLNLFYVLKIFFFRSREQIL